MLAINSAFVEPLHLQAMIKDKSEVVRSNRRTLYSSPRPYLDSEIK